MVPPEPPPSSTCHSKSAKEYVTAHKIALMVLIKEFSNVKQRSFHKRPLQMADEVLWEHTVQQNKHFPPTVLMLIQNPDMELRAFINIIQPMLHNKTYEIFIEKLKHLRKNGIAAIMDYIISLDVLLVEPAPVLPVVQKSSVMGLFIRHMLLAFDKLSFSLVTKLCRQFHSYFDGAFEQDSDGSFNLKSDSPKEENDDDECQLFASQKQAEFFIAQQAALLQINESAALSPCELQIKIKDLMKGNPGLYEACYLSYLNSLRVKEYCGAKHNLIHHFDRNTAVPQDLQTNKNVTVSEDLTRSSRYAALNLAILHALFGHKTEALASLNEAIMVAQEVNDNVCLQYSLAWLYRLTDDNKEVLIERSIAKSTELGLWCLSSLGIQALTKLKSLTSTLPSSIFELLTKSDVQNCVHSMTDLIGSALSLRGSLWSYYGFGIMTIATNQMLVYMNTGDPLRGGVYHIGEGACLSLTNIAWYFASQGYYKAVEAILLLAKALFPPHSEFGHIWQLSDLIIKFERALYQGKWLKAQQLQKGIAIFDQEEAQLRKAQLLLNQGNLAEADSILKKILAECNSTQVSPHFRVRTLLLRSELLSMTPNYIIALPQLMTCLAQCDTHFLSNLRSLTLMQVATLQLELGLPQQARILLDDVYITLIVSGSFYDRGSCCFLYARCLTLIAMQNEKNTEKCKKDILKALCMSNRALAYWEKVKAINKIKSILSWQAHMYNHLNMEHDRNTAAYRYRNIEDELT